jgi:hypothetical protein
LFLTGNFLDKHKLTNEKPLVELAKELSESTCERESLATHSWRGAMMVHLRTLRPGGQWEHLRSQVLHVTQQQKKKPLKTHFSPHLF